MSLHKEYAITPEVFDPDCHESAGVYCAFMTGLKSGLEGLKFLRCDKDQWLSEAGRKASGTMAGKAILAHLIKSKRLLHDAHSRTSHDWVSHFEASHKEHPMSGLLIDELSDDSAAQTLPHTRVSQMTPDSPAWWFDGVVSDRINCSAYAISACFRTLLRNAREIHLIDPYFDPRRQGYAPVFKALYEEISLNRHQPSVYIHSSDRKLREFDNSDRNWKEHALQKFKLMRPKFPPSRMRLSLCIWYMTDFHDRYFLTDLGGCEIGRGFVELNNKKTTVTALSEKTRIGILRDFFPSKNANPQVHEMFEI